MSFLYSCAEIAAGHPFSFGRSQLIPGTSQRAHRNHTNLPRPLWDLTDPSYGGLPLGWKFKPRAVTWIADHEGMDWSRTLVIETPEECQVVVLGAEAAAASFDNPAPWPEKTVVKVGWPDAKNAMVRGPSRSFEDMYKLLQPFESMNRSDCASCAGSYNDLEMIKSVPEYCGKDCDLPNAGCLIWIIFEGELTAAVY